MSYSNSNYIDGVVDNYLYIKNMQGDIIHICDQAGNIVASYHYDAWGVTTLSDAPATIAYSINPFRYRGYYFDVETGLYYLNSRYYDPVTGRFLNADKYVGANGDINSYNLYAYCSNNPVMYIDPSGESITVTTLIFIGIALGATLGFGAAAYVDYVDDGEVFNGSVGIADYLVTTIIGGAIGAAAAYAAPAIGTFLFSTFTLATPSIVGGTAAAVSVTGAQIAVVGVAAVGATIALFAKPDSGRIKFSDGTGIDPETGKEFTDKYEAINYYKKLTDSKMKNHWKKWLKGKGWMHNHLK